MCGCTLVETQYAAMRRENTAIRRSAMDILYADLEMLCPCFCSRGKRASSWTTFHNNNRGSSARPQAKGSTWNVLSDPLLKQFSFNDSSSRTLDTSDHSQAQIEMQARRKQSTQPSSSSITSSIYSTESDSDMYRSSTLPDDLKMFPYETLRVSTNNFSPHSFLGTLLVAPISQFMGLLHLGKGAYSNVYAATLSAESAQLLGNTSLGIYCCNYYP